MADIKRSLDQGNAEPQEEQPTLLYSASISDLQIFRLHDAQSCRFRFVDTTALLQRDRLTIWSFATIPSFQYAAVSYVWDGLPPSKASSKEIDIEVVGGLLKVNIDVLRLICLFTQQENVNLLWIDCLCIMQTHEGDKNWQIWRMAEIYKNCAHCVVLPGGIRRLLRLRWREESQWIKRSWTLQEAVLPRATSLLFEWNLGSGTINGEIELLGISGTNSAHCGLDTILNYSLGHYLDAQKRDSNPKEIFIPATGTTDVLLREHGPRCFSKMLASGTAQTLLRDVKGDEKISHDYAVWECIYERYSSRPIDRIFSCMNLLDINLDPDAFQAFPDPSYTALIKLAQVYLEQGGQAYWLGSLRHSTENVSFDELCREGIDERQLAPGLDRRSCTFLTFAKNISKAKRNSESEVHNFNATTRVLNAPMGKMDDNGYLTIKVNAARLPFQKHFSTSSCWQITLCKWTHTDSSPYAGGNNCNAIIIEHAPNRWHIAYVLDIRTEKWINGRFTQIWEEKEFSIGGPEPIAVFQEKQRTMNSVKLP